MEDVRDIVIIVFGITATAFTLVLLAMMLILFRKVLAVIDSAQRTVNRVEAFSQEVLEPITRAFGIVGAAWRALSSLLGQPRQEKHGAKGSGHGN